MPWIEFHPSTIKKLQKFRDFKKYLGWSVNEALGCLGNLWGEIMELREDGDVTGWTPDYVAELAAVQGSPQKFWDALVKHGWIDLTEDGRALVHDWVDFAGPYLRKKYGGGRNQKGKERLEEIWALHGRDPASGAKAALKRRLSGAKASPPSPSLPDQRPIHARVVPGPGGQGVALQQVEGSAGEVARMDRERRLMSLQMPFGERRGVHVQNLEPDYCAWLLNEWAGRRHLSAALREALELRVRLKREESRAH